MSRRRRGFARSAVVNAAFVRPSRRSGGGGTWTPASTGRSCTRSRRERTVPSMGSAWCDCPGPSRTVGSRRCSSGWRSTGCKAANQPAVADQMGLTWDEVHGIMERAVRRGLSRRKAENDRVFGGGREVVPQGAPVSDDRQRLGAGPVLYVAEDRKQSSLDGFWPTLTEEQKDGIAGRGVGHVGALRAVDPSQSAASGGEDGFRQVPRVEAPERSGGQGPSGEHRNCRRKATSG